MVLFILPLWVLEWGPLKVEHTVESNIATIQRLPERSGVSRKPFRILNKTTPGPKASKGAKKCIHLYKPELSDHCPILLDWEMPSIFT